MKNRPSPPHWAAAYRRLCAVPQCGYRYPSAFPPNAPFSDLPNSEIFQFPADPFQNRADAVGPAAPGGVQAGFHQPRDGLQHAHRFGAKALAPVFPTLGPLPDAAHVIRGLGQFAKPGLGDAVNLFAGLLIGLDQFLVFQLLQGGIDAAGAGFVEPSGALGHFLHQLIAVLGTLAEQGEDGQPYFAGLEEPAGLPKGKSRPRAVPGKAPAPVFLTHDVSQDISSALSAQEFFHGVFSWGSCGKLAAGPQGARLRGGRLVDQCHPRLRVGFPAARSRRAPATIRCSAMPANGPAQPASLRCRAAAWNRAWAT